MKENPQLDIYLEELEMLAVILHREAERTGRSSLEVLEDLCNQVSLAPTVSDRQEWRAMRARTRAGLKATAAWKRSMRVMAGWVAAGVSAMLGKMLKLLAMPAFWLMESPWKALKTMVDGFRSAVSRLQRCAPDVLCNRTSVAERCIPLRR